MTTSITVRINGQERHGVDEGWIGQTISAFQRVGKPVCVELHVDQPTARVRFSMGNCGGAGGGGGLSEAAARLGEAWIECTRGGGVEPGQAIKCIKRIERMVS